MNLDASLVGAMTPVIATLVTLGMPVALVFIVKHFAFRHRELDAEIEARKFWNESERAQFQARIERLESALFQRASPSLSDRSLLESPAAEGTPRQIAGRRDPVREK
jgi:hypothetical protein